MTRYEPGSRIRTAMNFFERQGAEIQFMSTPFLINHDLVFAYLLESGQIDSVVVVDITTSPLFPRLRVAGEWHIREYF